MHLVCYVSLLFCCDFLFCESSGVHRDLHVLTRSFPTRRSSDLEAAFSTVRHSRRHEAELRLRAAETNLERLDDVIATLEAQLQGLKKQARQATRYRNLADQIRRFEAIVLHLEGTEARGAVARAEAAFAEAEKAVAEATERSDAHTSELPALILISTTV